MLSLLLWTIPFAFLQVVVHEAAHALAARAYGLRVTSFKPWPHFVGGRLFFGRVTYGGPGNKVISAAPVALAVLLTVLLCGLMLVFPAKVLAAWSACTMADATRGMAAPMVGGEDDLSKIGINKSWSMVAAVFFCFAWCVWVLGVLG